MIILGLFTALTLTANANSVTHEAKLKNQNGESHLEWTLAKGKYGLTDNIDFIFDVDKDLFFDSNKDHGWDTKFGVHSKFNKVNFLGKEWGTKAILEFEYDNVYNTSDVKTYERLRYTAGIGLSTKTDNDWSLTITPKFQYSNNTFGTDSYKYELNTQLYKNFGSGFDFFAELYPQYAVKGDNEGFIFEYEQYITYTKQFGESPIYLWTEFGVEAYGLFSTIDNPSIDVYLNPQIQYRTSIKALDLTAYAGTTFYAAGNSDDNEYQGGVKFSTKF